MSARSVRCYHLPLLALIAMLCLTAEHATAQQPAYAPAPPQWKVDAASNSMVLLPTQAKLALGRPTAQTPLHVMGGSVTAEPGTGYVTLGPLNGPHMQLDRNDIRVAGSSNSTFGALYLQRYGGRVVVHGSKPLEERVYITTEGDVGVGVATPLEFAEALKLRYPSTNRPPAVVGVDGAVYAKDLGSRNLNVLERVRIGRSEEFHPGYPTVDLAFIDAVLQVAGTATAQRIVVHLAMWADDVFDDDYPLIPLDELSEFIQRERHLPGVPTQAEVQTTGLDVAEANAILLRKVEELTLYIIAQQERIDTLEKRVDALAK
jgi:hypothetical protein